MSNHAHRLLLVLFASLVATGCAAGKKEIPDVKSCLKDAGMKVEPFDKTEKQVKEGVFATTDLTKGDHDTFTLAVAAYVKNEKTVDEFKDDVKDFSDALSVGKRKLVIDSDVDGDYVWVVTGVKEDKVFKAAVDCVG
jgi:hypothetical protein